MRVRDNIQLRQVIRLSLTFTLLYAITLCLSFGIILALLYRHKYLHICIRKSNV
jgi:hypothetical protein